MEIAISKMCTYTGTIKDVHIVSECNFIDDIFSIKNNEGEKHKWMYKRDENKIKLYDENSKIQLQFVKNK